VAALEIISAKVSSVTEEADPNIHGHLQDLAPMQDDGSAGGFNNVERRLDLGKINFNLNDMSWLNSMPGNF